MQQVGIPDYSFIQSEVKNKNSRWYYPVLMDKAINLDSQLTLQDYHFLYYGYIFSENYLYVDLWRNNNKIMYYLKKKNKTAEEYRIITDLMNKSRKEYPFDWGKTGMIINLYREIKNEEMANKLSNQFEMMKQVILSSGDGKNKQTAMHVISVPHEYNILFLKGYLNNRLQFIDNKYDIFDVADSKNNFFQIYFNIEQLINKSPKNLNKVLIS